MAAYYSICHSKGNVGDIHQHFRHSTTPISCILSRCYSDSNFFRVLSTILEIFFPIDTTSFHVKTYFKSPLQSAFLNLFNTEHFRQDTICLQPDCWTIFHDLRSFVLLDVHDDAKIWSRLRLLREHWYYSGDCIHFWVMF